jgi:hypothetical protein
LSGVYAADLVDAASLGAMSEILFCQSRKEHNKTIFRQLLAEKFKSGSISCCNCTDASNSREYIDLYERLLSDFATEPAGQ